MSETGFARVRALYEARGMVSDTHLDLTWRCNLSCVHCFWGPDSNAASDPRPELNRDEILGLVDQLHALGVFRVTVSGGEATLHPHLQEILADLRRRAFRVSLKTNGTLLDDDLTRTLAELGIRDIDITLFSADAAVHDAITQVPGSWARTLAGVDLARVRGARVRLSIPILAQNADGLDATLDLADERADEWLVGGGIVGEYACHDRRWGLNLTPARAREIAAYVGRRTGRAGTRLRPNAPESRGCGAGVTGIYVSPQGDVTPCMLVTAPLGNIRHQPLADILAGPARARYADTRRRDWPGCQGCALLPYCVHCLGIAERLTGSPWLRHPDLCRRTINLLHAGGHDSRALARKGRRDGDPRGSDAGRGGPDSNRDRG